MEDLIDYSIDSFQLVSYKNPKQRKLHYYIIHSKDNPSNDRVINNVVMYLYGIHAVGTYQEMSHLIR